MTPFLEHSDLRMNIDVGTTCMSRLHDQNLCRCDVSHMEWLRQMYGLCMSIIHIDTS